MVHEHQDYLTVSNTATVHSLRIFPYILSDLPTDNDNGTLYFDEDRGLPTWWDRDHFEWPTFVDNNDVSTSTTTVSNTTIETEVARMSTNPKALVEGRVLIVNVFGSYSTLSTNDEFTYRLYTGDEGFDATSGEGNLVTELTTTQEFVTDGPFQVETSFTVLEEGSNGKLAAHSNATFNNTKNDDHVVGGTQANTETSESFVVTVQWNNADPENSVTCGQSYLQQQA